MNKDKPDLLDLTGVTCRWVHHDERTLPQGCTGVVVRHLQPEHQSPDWVEVKFILAGVPVLRSMRGSEAQRVLPSEKSPCETIFDARRAVRDPAGCTHKKFEGHRPSINVLREKGYSWREIASFMRERGVVASYTTWRNLFNKPQR